MGDSLAFASFSVTAGCASSPKICRSDDSRHRKSLNDHACWCSCPTFSIEVGRPAYGAAFASPPPGTATSAAGLILRARNFESSFDA